MDLIDEPPVYARSLADGFYTDAHHQGILDAEDPVPLGCFEVFHDLISMHQAFAVVSKSHCIVLQALTGFLDGFGETSSDGHHLTNRFHLQSECIVGALELVKIPAGNLHNHIIQGRFKVSRGCFGDLVLQFIKRKAQGQLGSDFGNGISRCFGCKG